MKNIIKIIYLALSLVIIWECKANPAPFGFELGKASLEDIESKQKVLNKNSDKFGGILVWIEHEPFGLEGLKDLMLGFDNKNILQAVQLTMGVENYDSMCQALGSKYRLIAKDQYHNGRKGSLFKSGNTSITILVAEDPADIRILYLTADMSKTMNLVEKKDKERKIQQGKAKL